MAKLKRIIRKLKTDRDPSFDESLWPVNVALILLGGFLLGVVLATCRFDNPNFWQNAWTWIVVLVVGVGGGIYVVRLIENRLVRRTVQLSLVLSVLVHSVLVVALFFWGDVVLEMIQDKIKAAIERPKEKPPVMPVYHEVNVPNNQARRKQAHEKPVDTPTAEEKLDNEKAQEDQPELRQPRHQPTLQPEQEQRVDPHELKKQKAQQTAPRRATDESKRSRRLEPKEEALVAQAKLDVKAPPIDRPKPAKQVEPKPDVTKRQDSPTPTTQPRKEPSPEEPAPMRREQPRIVRRNTSDATPAPAVSSTKPTRRKNVTKVTATETPKSEVAPPPTPRKPKPDTVAQATAAEIKRRQSDSPTPSQAKFDAPAKAPRAPSVDPPKQRRRQPDTSQQVARRTPQPSPTRRQRQTNQPVPLADAPAATSRPSRSPSPRPRPDVQPVASAHERASAPAPTGEVTPRTSPQPAAASRSRLATQTRRRRVSKEPSLRPQADPRRAPQRALARSARPVTPTATSSPAAASGARTASRPELTPTRESLRRATGGVVGVGNSANMDRGKMAAPSQRTATVASASMKRAESLTTTPVPAGIHEPSDAPRRRRTTATVHDTTASVRKVDPRADTLATDAGTRNPTNYEAQTSAAERRRAADATLAAIDAAKGRLETDVDRGPDRILPEQGQGRASGGGQPELNRATDSVKQLFTRKQSGGAPEAAIAKADVDPRVEAPAAPMTAGGGTPDDPEKLRDAESLVRTSDDGDEAPVSGGPSAANKRGPAVAMNSSQIVGDTDLARSAAADAQEGPSRTGGGTKTQRRRRGVDATAAVVKADISGPQAPSESGGSEPSPSPAAPDAVADEDDEEKSEEGGVQLATASPAADGAPGADNLKSSDAPAQVGQLALRRADTGVGVEGPAPTQASTGTSRRRSARTTSSPQLVVAKADAGTGQSPILPSPGGSTGTTEALPVEGDVVEHSRSGSSTGGIQVPISADDGPGGLGPVAATDAGIDSRRASRESYKVRERHTRFIRKASGGLPAVSVVAAAPAEAFAKRGDRLRRPPSDPDSRTNATIESALSFVARMQEDDGGWRLDCVWRKFRHRGERTTFQSDTAATGLALMSFLGAAYTHKEHRYREVVDRGLNFLVQHQKGDGLLYIEEDEYSNKFAVIYSHSMATIALCEAYGMTQDVHLREPTQKALDWLVKAQHKTRGGWRYTPGRSSDTSVAGWAVVALVSGKLAGLNVPQSTFEKSRGWLDKAQLSDDEPYKYVYNPYAANTAEQRHHRRASPAITAAGLLMRKYLGWDADDERMLRGARYLLEHKPTMQYPGDHAADKRDTYYWYYATQVMLFVGGKEWDQWKAKLHPMLLDTQVKSGPLAGSWDPNNPTPDRWGKTAGRLYVTTLNILSLEAEYRHLPTYKALD